MPQACRPSTLRTMSDPEVAWLAGILEGEGSFMCWVTNRGNRTVRISMGSTDIDVLERVAEVVGVGTVRAIKPQYNKFGKKPIWHWHIARKADVRALSQLLRPWLGERRRQQVDAILAATDSIRPQPPGYCVNGHPIIDGNRAGTGLACRRCANERRRRQRSSQTL